MPNEPGPTPRADDDRSVVRRPTLPNLRVSGTLPTALNGKYVQVSPDGLGLVVHTVTLDPAGTAGYSCGRIVARAVDGPQSVGRRPGWKPAGDDVDTSRLFEFGGSLFAVGDGTLAFELDVRRGSSRPVDLAGAQRRLVAARVDPGTGDLHLLTAASPPPQLHVVVPRGGLTRTIRSIEDAPATIRELEPIHDGVVLVADGWVGVTGRAGARVRHRWYELDSTGHRIATVGARGDTVLAHAIGSSLVRWALDRRMGIVRAETLDAAPHTFAIANPSPNGLGSRFLWSVGSGKVHRHDLLAGGLRSHDFADDVTPRGLVFVADPDRRHTDAGGWLLTVVRHAESGRTELVVLDADAVERPALATVALPREMADSSHGAWTAGGAAQI